MRTCTMLGFLALTVISTQSHPTPGNPLDRSSTTESVYGLVSRDLITETPLAASMSTSSSKITTHGPASSALPSQTSFSLPQQSQWGPGDISNIFFGCVASVLGAITVGLTYYLHRRQSRGQQSDDSMELENMQSFEPSDGLGGGDLPREDPPPAYASVDSSAGSLGQGFPTAPRQQV
ncbi:hypothetical protein MMC07_007560 [Pseudocyphellaria aurata]|nr:hypothetical protein [Pseudocyphellaria aurata]